MGYANVELLAGGRRWSFKISEDMLGKGFMTEILQAAIAYIFKELNLHRVSANYMPHNNAKHEDSRKMRICSGRYRRRLFVYQWQMGKACADEFD